MGDAKPAVRRVGAIPLRVRVGVTGHRQLPDDPALTARVSWTLQRIQQLTRASPATSVQLAAVSPLAEGADRLIAHQVLQTPGGTLEVPLPLPQSDYRVDFSSEESRRQFDALLAQAGQVVALPPAGTREEAYDQAGHYVVDWCDVLIALWDGHPARGQGGTADVVARARERGLPLFWISPESPFAVQEERGAQLSMLCRDLDVYNRGAVDDTRLARHADQQAALLLEKADQAGLSRDVPLPFWAWMAPYLARAATLARQRQRRFSQLGAAQYLLAAAAVAAGALQSTLFPTFWPLAWLEVVFLGVILALLVVGRRSRAQERWIAYRAVAERLRSCLFLALAGAEAAHETETERVTLSHPSEQWIQRAVVEVWSTRPAPVVLPGEVAGLKRFLSAAWLQEQRRYHQKASRRHARRHRRLIYASAAAFAVTLIAALLHAFGWLDTRVAASSASTSWGSVLILVTIALPALAGALRGVGVQQEFLRNAERSGRTISYLGAIQRRLEAARDLPGVRRVAQDAARLMLEENHDWYTVMLLHDIELDT